MSASLQRLQKGSTELYFTESGESYAEKLFDFANAPARFGKQLAQSGSVSRGTVYVSNNLFSGTRIVLRPLLRGGVPSHFSKKLYLGFGEPRPLSELKTLTSLTESSVSVVAPVAAFVKRHLGGLAYSGALLTQYKENSQSLDELLLSSSDETTDAEISKLVKISREAGSEAARCLQEGVFHQDLHPSNVLVADGKVVLLDFDKAQKISAGEVVRYVRLQNERWSRFLEKHERPFRKEIANAFAQGIREIIH